jgi:hypothetical protein
VHVSEDGASRRPESLDLDISGSHRQKHPFRLPLLPRSQATDIQLKFQIIHGIVMSILFSSLVLSASVPVAIATSNATVPTVGWVSDPNGRGTFSLVFSCLLTLGLCVWSAMHLNIPPHNESPAKTWLRNLKWGVIGTFGPELVVFAAWRQYNSARTLCAEVKRHVEIEKLMQPRRDEVENGSKVN